MAKKGRIERNNRVLRVIESQREKREKLKAQKEFIVKDYSKKVKAAKTEQEANELKQKASQELYQLSVIFQKLPRDGSMVRYRNRCAMTGRPRGYRSFFDLSRNVIRESASFGLIMGLKKSSW